MIERLRRLSPEVLFGLAAAASAALLVYLVSNLSFLLDEWDMLLLRRGISADVLLEPHGEHLTLAPIVIWKAIQATIGMETTVPYEIAAVAFFVAAAALLFAHLRLRVGAWLALAGAVMILFLGSAWEDLLSPFQIGYFGSMAAGLGALLALGHGDRNGDRLACMLLVASLTFSSVALPFVAAAAVGVALEPERRRRAYVVVVPTLLFALWWLGWGRDADSSFTFDNLATSPAYILDGFASSLSSLLGLAAPRDDLEFTALEWGRPLLVGALVLAGLRLHTLEWRVPKGLLVAATFGLVFWFLAGINAGEFRPPTAVRYQYVGAIAILLIAAELLRGIRPGRTALTIVFALVGLTVLGNLSAMRDAYHDLKGYSAVVRGSLAGLELGRDRAAPGFVLTQENSGFDFLGLVDAGRYLSAIDEFGSPAYPATELAGAPETGRAAADRVLASVYELAFEPFGGGPLPRSCVTAPASGGEPRVLEVPPGGLVLELGPGGGKGALRRYASESFPVELGNLPSGASRLEIPADRSNEPWELELAAPGPVRVCRV